MSTAWLHALLNGHLPYNRTNKNPDEAVPQRVQQELVWAVVLGISALIAFITTENFSLKIIALISGSFALFLSLASLLLTRALNQTRLVTQKLMSTW